MMETKINQHSFVHLIITAAGSSSRMGTGTKKEYLKLQDKDDNTVLSLACFSFLKTFKDLQGLHNEQNLATDQNVATKQGLHNEQNVATDQSFATKQDLHNEQNVATQKTILKSITITCPKQKITTTKEALFCNKKNEKLIKELHTSIDFIEGGHTRQSSVFNALSAIQSKNPTETDIVLIHDGARPWVDSATIQNVLETTLLFGASVPAVPVADTTAIVKDNVIQKYVERSSLYNLQTPQGFNLCKLFKAHNLCQKENKTDCTDDTTLWATYCGQVHICEGSVQNKKITFKGDL